MDDDVFRTDYGGAKLSDHVSGSAIDLNGGTRVVFDETHYFRGIKVDGRGWGKTVEQARLVAEHMGRSLAETAKAIQALVDALPTVPVVPFAREHLNSWAAPPQSVMERAIEAKKHRSTGPARPSAASARRPRRHQ